MWSAALRRRRGGQTLIATLCRPILRLRSGTSPPSLGAVDRRRITILCKHILRSDRPPSLKEMIGYQWNSKVPLDSSFVA